MTIDLGHWQHAANMNPDDYWGFVYVIANNTRDVSYIGMKAYDKTGKWKTYQGSCKPLLADIQAGHEIRYHILTNYRSRSACRLGEIEWQIKTNAIRSPGYYNRVIGGLLWTKCLSTEPK